MALERLWLWRDGDSRLKRERLYLFELIDTGLIYYIDSELGWAAVEVVDMERGDFLAITTN